MTGPDGDELSIVRANMPFGSPGQGEFGTYYIAYSASPSVTELMLENMFIGRPPGNTDRILDFSTAVTGSLFFAPAADFLENPPDAAYASAGAAAGEAAVEAAPAGGTPSDDGSLGIGSLKG